MRRNGNFTPIERVLVEIHSDGFIKVYGSKQICCRIINRPYAPNSQSEIVADQLINEILPIGYREIYWPGMIRQTGQFQIIRPSDIQQRVDQLRLLNAIGRITNKIRPRYRSVNEAIREIIEG